MEIRNRRTIEILLVDDDLEDIRLMVHGLKQTTMYHNLNIAHDGVEAMDFLHCPRTLPTAPRPDIILLDLNMPRMDGRELLTEIKQDPDLHLIPVVIFTTSSNEDDLRQAYELRANSYLTKPADLEQFLQWSKRSRNSGSASQRYLAAWWRVIDRQANRCPGTSLRRGRARRR
jgi:two-component system, chemotaxis family, response regulator Rcp1